MSLPKSLSLAAFLVAVAVLVLSMLIAATGRTGESIANVIFLLGLLVSVVLGVAAGVVAAAQRGGKRGTA